MTYRTLSDGTKTSLLGYGCMRLPTMPDLKGGTPKAHIDQQTLNAHVDWMLEHGINYFDTSPAYCQGESEAAMGEALSRHPRDRYLLSTKLSNFAPPQFPADRCKEMLEQSLVRLKTDHVDFYLLHSVGNGGFETFRKRYIDNGIIPWLFEQKRLGRIRHLGFSYHGDVKSFEWLLEQHDMGVYHWDFSMIQMNYVDWFHAKQVNKINTDASWLYRELDRREIPVVVMEPLLGGTLARHNEALAGELVPLNPEATQASWAFRFCGTYPRVMTVLSGMTHMENIEENVATFSPLKPLTDSELVTLERAAVAFLGTGNVPCTACNYCMPCPYGLDIPTLIRFINDVHGQKITDRSEIRRRYAAAVPDPRRRADRCIGCGKCAPHCPQSIAIPKIMDSIAAFVENFA